MIIGLTGGIGSGKSSAANFFIELGIDVIDADEVSKNILDFNKEAKNEFIDSFGKEFLDTNNNIDRDLLRSIIFKDEHKKSLLESIVHPLVREEILKFIENSKSIYKIIMVPLIFETKSESFYDKIVVVDCKEVTTALRRKVRQIIAVGARLLQPPARSDAVCQRVAAHKSVELALARRLAALP